MQQRARAELESKTLSEVADWWYLHYDNPACKIAAQAEFWRRQTAAVIQTARFTLILAAVTALAIVVSAMT